MALVCRVISQDHVIKVSYNFMAGSPSRLVTTLPSLEVTDIVVVKICFQWLKSKIPYTRLNPSLLFIFKAYGIKTHGLSC